MWMYRNDPKSINKSLMYIELEVLKYTKFNTIIYDDTFDINNPNDPRAIKLKKKIDDFRQKRINVLKNDLN